MLLLNIWNYIRGYVIIIVEGYFLEKFMNICMHRQIFLWDIKRSGNNYMILKISIKGFKLLRPIARKTRSKVRIKARRGLPFIMHRYKGRKAFMAGAFLFVSGFFILTSFIWDVEVTGNKKIETAVLVEMLEDAGIRPGVLKYGVQADKIVNRLMLENSQLAWMGIGIKGTRVKVEVAERVNPPVVIPKDIPCDIVAAKDGIIKSIIVKAGQEAVKIGDTVQKGQVLVSSSVPNKDQNIPPRQVHAMAEVKARTWYENSASVNTKTVEIERTGNKYDNYGLMLFSNVINFLPVKHSFEEYDKIEIKKALSIGSDIVLPIGIVINRYLENTFVEREVSIDVAKKDAFDRAYKQIIEGVPKTAVQVNTNMDFVEKEDGRLYAVVTVECLEDIGITKEIGGN